MKIGIPRALLYYYYFPFWQALFEYLGYEVVLSQPTTTNILNGGVKEATPEICVPIKVYVGHVLELLAKNVDKIYVPRFVSIRKGVTFCPKFLGLPDMLKYSLRGVENKILTHIIKSGSDDISEYNNYRTLMIELGIKGKKLREALAHARHKWHDFRRLQQMGYGTEGLLAGQNLKQNDGDLTIALLGYVYNMYDRFINMGLIDKLQSMGVKIVTFEGLTLETIAEELKQFDKLMFWEFTNKILGAGYHFIHSPEISGIIHVTAFGCGPDSILGPFLEIEAEKYSKPFMTLRIDEQTGESHLLTRIEAFTDLLKLNRKQERIKKVDAG